MKLLFLIIISVNIVFSQKAMFDPNDAESLNNLYVELINGLWEYDSWKEIDKDKIYSNPSQLNRTGILTKYERDTIIENETISIYSVSKLEIGTPIKDGQRIPGGQIPPLNFVNLEELTIEKLNGAFGLESINYFSLKKLYIKDCNIWGKLDLNSMPKLEVVDVYKADIDINLYGLNLPNCKILKLIGTKLRSTLTIINLQKVEDFQIREWYNHEWDYQEPGQFSLYGSDIKEIKKLVSAKHIAICYAAILGNLDTIDMPVLEKLELYANGISGSFPVIISPNLKYIDMQGNGLTSFSEEMSHQNLEHLNLQGNKFDGKLPVFNTPNLEYLDLSRNKFTSGFTSNIITDSLVYLSLVANKFDQEIDFEIKSKNLECINLSHNYFKGDIPPLNLPNSYVIDLSENSFTKITNEIILNENTYFAINSNNLEFWDLYCRIKNNKNKNCLNENRITVPEFILEHFKPINEIHLKYLGTDVLFDENNYGCQPTYQSSRLKLSYDVNTKKLIPSIIDSNFMYDVHYIKELGTFDLGESGLNIYDPIYRTGYYQVTVKLDICSPIIGKSEYLFVDFLTVPSLNFIEPKQFQTFTEFGVLLDGNLEVANVELFNLEGKNLNDLVIKTNNKIYCRKYNSVNSAYFLTLTYY